MTREELIKMVALKMDEISSSDDVIIPVNESDNNPLYTQINNMLNESVNDVLMKAPIYRIQNQVEEFKVFADINLFGNTRKAAVFAVPEDFIRIASISDAAFQRPIVDLSLEGDATDKKQRNRFLVAKKAKPVGVLGRGASGRIITCYSYDTADTIAPTLLYIKRYNNATDTNSETDLDEYLTDIVSWVCAGKVFSVQGDTAKSKICDDNAAALMI
jgi:hypothetical protein